MEKGSKTKEMRNRLKKDVLDFLLNDVNEQNFDEKYDDIANLVLKYRFLPKEEVISELTTLSLELVEKDILSDSQDDVFIDLFDRLQGICDKSRHIDW